MKNDEKAIIFTDGGSRGNPGPSAIGVVICDAGGKTLKAYAEDIGKGTNNEAEYHAVISALKKAKSLFGTEKSKQKEIDVYSDSELMVKQLNGEYKVHDDRMKMFFMEVWNLKMDFKCVTFCHIMREQNVQADQLLNQKLDEVEGKGKLF